MQGVQVKNSDPNNSRYTQKDSQELGLGRSNTENLDKSMGSISHEPVPKNRKMAKGFSKFFEKNEISANVTTVGRNKNVRFGPDGVLRVTQAKINEAKKRQEKIVESERIKARKKLIKKLRQRSRPLGSLSLSQNTNSGELFQQDEDVLSPLQCLVLLDVEIASTMFCDLFGVDFANIFDKEPSQEIKDQICEAAIKILSQSVM